MNSVDYDWGRFIEYNTDDPSQLIRDLDSVIYGTDEFGNQVAYKEGEGISFEDGMISSYGGSATIVITGNDVE